MRKIITRGDKINKRKVISIKRGSHISLRDEWLDIYGKPPGCSVETRLSLFIVHLVSRNDKHGLNHNDANVLTEANALAS